MIARKNNVCSLERRGFSRSYIGTRIIIGFRGPSDLAFQVLPPLGGKAMGDDVIIYPRQNSSNNPGLKDLIDEGDGRCDSREVRQSEKMVRCRRGGGDCDIVLLDINSIVCFKIIIISPHYIVSGRAMQPS
ncbi:hypothetical protein EVAR_18339_1 [Eumeta japonica]|uniref:Uncharacterized protein n=1 Tax=Eumeta variegata TaxID=151549 RepID=A0A4C1VB77_EUMVA|nr:hypothetical protein EVAR_18339_1 [Eumeta japonica]